MIVELALRQQLATYNQKKAKPRLTSLDRAFWVTLFKLWPGWRQALVIVKPDTVVRWHRKGFKLYWRWISKPGDDAAAPARLLLWNRALDRGEEARDRDGEGLVDVMRLDGEQRLERSRRSVRDREYELQGPSHNVR